MNEFGGSLTGGGHLRMMLKFLSDPTRPWSWEDEPGGGEMGNL